MVTTLSHGENPHPEGKGSQSSMERSVEGKNKNVSHNYGVMKGIHPSQLDGSYSRQTRLLGKNTMSEGVEKERENIEAITSRLARGMQVQHEGEPKAGNPTWKKRARVVTKPN